MGEQAVDYLRRIYESGRVSVSGQPVTISGQHVFIESGAYVVADIAESGIGVQTQSGIHVWVSGQHVFVESGVYVVADIAESGMGVWISGQHVYVESGTHVVISGQSVLVGICYPSQGGPIPTPLVTDCSGRLVVGISGQHVYVESGVYIVGVSGKPVSVSGNIVQISGQHVFVESGVYLASGLHVGISGQHVYQESGAFVTVESGIGVTVDPSTSSGQVIHVGCADTIRTGQLVQLTGGRSGDNIGSGGMSICVSGYWCSGPVHTVILKNLAGNDPVFVGESGCRPFSGWGFLLSATEAINLDICDVCNIYVYAVTSGEYITWIGTDY